MKRLLILLLLAANSVFGQIVNIENKRLSGDDQGFHGSADLKFNLTMTHKELIQLGDRFRLGYTHNRHHAMLITDHAFVKSRDDAFVNRGYEHLRYNYKFKDSGRVMIEAFQQAQFDKIRKIDLRLLLGTGLRFSIIDKKKYQLSFGTGFMGEYEELTEQGISRDILSTSYLSFDGQFTESFGFNTISYFQPKFIDFGHYRFANETYIRLKINKFLTFKLVYSLIHDSRNIEGVRKTNYTLSNTLSFNF